MAEVEIIKTTAPHQWSQDGEELNWTMLDAANGNFFNATSDMMMIAWNKDASPQTLDVTSQPHPETERTGDISQILASMEVRMFRLTYAGWADSESKVHLPSGQSPMMAVAIVPLVE